MGGSGDWPGDTGETQRLGVSGDERQILAALAVVGNASLSADELADLGNVDVVPLLESLEQRGLVRLDDWRRYSAAGGVGEQFRRTDVGTASGDRLLAYFSNLARRGSLSTDRLGDDAAAIVGLAEWAAEAGRYEGLLDLVRTLQPSFATAQRSGQWLTLLERAHTAARTLGDRGAEIWALQQLATAAAAAGNTEAAQRYLREADRLQQPPAMQREVRSETVVAPPPQQRSGGVPAWVLWLLGVIAALAGGVALGYVINNGSSNSSDTTTPISVTITRPGRTLTTQETVTLPATTDVTTSIETTTVETTVTSTG